jgi:predicted NUDIX family NTP pyrophosphohydrolase
VPSPKRISSRPNVSAGILAYRRGKLGLEVLLAKEGRRCLVHPERRNRRVGGSRAGCHREFAEELGPTASIGPLQALGEIRQRGGKRVIAFCGEGDFDPTMLASNTFEIEWPPRSGRRQAFPEVDRAEWFDLETAKTKVLSGQIDLIDRLAKAGF